MISISERKGVWIRQTSEQRVQRAGGPFTVAVGGFASEVGKTTLACDLLRAFPGWEAIKLTRGHDHSCGKDPSVCCGGNLLRDESIVCSGRENNYIPGKDTARFWDAGASNVHWVIVTDAQVTRGIKLAFDRVRSPGVLIEGNSFIINMDVDFAVMVTRATGGKIKPTARRALEKTDALFLSDSVDGDQARRLFATWCEDPFHSSWVSGLPVYARENLAQLVTHLREQYSGLNL